VERMISVEDEEGEGEKAAAKIRSVAPYGS
jgi:hypothetical protein